MAKLYRSDTAPRPLHFSIARGCLGFRQSCYMAFFAYFDAAGDASDINEHEMAVSGFIAHESKWLEFEERWPEVLGRFGVTEFHMKEFAHFKGEFKQFKNDEPRRREFLQGISVVINECTERMFASAVDLDAFRWFDQRFHLSEWFGNAYTYALLHCMGQVSEWAEKQHLKEPLLFYVEKGDNQQPVFEKIMNRVDWAREPHAQPIVTPKRKVSDEDGTVSYVLPFQACDFLAYEHARATEHAKDGKLMLRKSASLISGYPKRWKATPRSVLWNHVKRMSIPPREHHVPNHDMPDGPLCFLGNDFPLLPRTFHN